MALAALAVSTGAASLAASPASFPTEGDPIPRVVATDPTYGLTPTNPIRVGGTAQGLVSESSTSDPGMGVQTAQDLAIQHNPAAGCRPHSGLTSDFFDPSVTDGARADDFIASALGDARQWRLRHNTQ